ncbi:hypothetical protein THERMOT_463 [Bathymodiolus thermophilus thioautotrophic gill symbiont]|nr:hypothetical protein THERMOT_463 [Bathymodiolus thermophilus thioautotrophic gill symbiont]
MKQSSRTHFSPTWKFLNLVLLRQGLKKSLIGQKLNFANHPYLYKGLILILLLHPHKSSFGG